MNDLAPPEHDARVRLTDDQAQELVLRTLATQSESLLRTAHRHSLCADDAHDAFQRSMEIFLRRARTLDPESAHRWLHVVVKHEAMEVRRARIAAVGYEEVDFDRQSSPHAPSPEEQVLGAERTRRATEALKRLKPQELRAMWLKASGHSYAEIGAVTGFSATKVNRSLTEGRRRFFDRFEGIESGVECERWRPVLTAIAEGKATAEQITDARPHLRNCPACRAQLRGLHRRPFAAVLPLGLLGTLSRLAERLLPGGAAGDAAASAASGTKLAALLATGAAATAGGGFVVAQETAGTGQHTPRAHTTTAVATPAASPVATTVTAAAAVSHTAARTTRTTPRPARKHLTARRHASKPSHIEFAPRGTEPSSPPPTNRPVAHAATPRQLPRQPTTPDSTHGEFSPQP
ncbi:RNA polymerase sigma factor [Baekduia sp. Peel2402]|uniref:RNA polymerase sigma factor n=1 Tax=Baekduia sp. Peel2402 TaxID=3458296 RepID=UPI00403E854B